MKKWLKTLLKSRYSYEPLITINISKSRLLHNLEQFRKVAPNGNIAPVLKSNAYGHGLYQVASILESQNVPFIVVDSYFEALALRNYGIKTPLLVIGYTRPETIVSNRLMNISFTITSAAMMRSVADQIKKRKLFKKRHFVRIHIKIDTGMRRQGILPDEVQDVLSILCNNNIEPEGIATHFADADNDDETFTIKQIKIWNEIVEIFKKNYPTMRYIHASNTDGHKYVDQINGNISRLGIGLYGLGNEEIIRKYNLRPVMNVKTVITSIRNLKVGECVGYGKTFVANYDMRIATIPFGYYEGLDRRLSNTGIIQVGDTNVPCPILGRISMNITTIDVSAVSQVKIDDPVTIYSDKTNDPNSIGTVATKIGEIDYVVCTKIPGELRRVIVD